MTKGNDRVIIKLSNGELWDISHDEVEQFLNAQYISSSEAYWRIYEFPIQDLYPSVEKLPIHLENEQSVLFQTETVQTIIANGPPKNKLTEFSG